MRRIGWQCLVAVIVVAGCASDDTSLQADAADVAVDATSDAPIDSSSGDSSVLDSGNNGDGVSPSDGSTEASTDDAPLDQSSPDVTVDDALLDATLSDADAAVDATSDAPIDGSSGDSSVLDSGNDGGIVNSCGLCPSGQKMCGDRCVSIDDPVYGCDPLFCNDTCSMGYKGTPACVANKCVVGSCRPGFADCDGLATNGCEVRLLDPSNCGGCGVVCDGGQVCTASGCATACAFPETNCNGSCENLTSSPFACGSCSQLCLQSHSTATCTSATCGQTCDSGYSLCGATCRDTTSGPNFCGASCTQCAAGPLGTVPVCDAGTCGLACTAGYASCSGSCVNFDSDAANCGGCGVTCGGGQICLDASCQTLDKIQIVTGLTTPNDIAVDSSNVYWTDIGTNDVWQADKTSFARTKLGSNQVKPLRVASDGTRVYWSSNLGGAIISAPVGGGSESVFASAASPSAIAVDGTAVYWEDSGTGSIKKAPVGVDAGAPATLVFPAACDEIAVDAKNVYCLFGVVGDGDVYAYDKVTGSFVWQQNDSHKLWGMATDSTTVTFVKSVLLNTWLIRIPKSGTQRYDAVDLTAHPPAFATADDCAYYFTDGAAGVWKLPAGASTPVALTSAAGAAKRVASDADHIYWVDAGWLGRVRK